MTTLDFSTIKKYHNLCDPYEYLLPKDPRNFDIDAHDRDHPVRGFQWSTRLTKAIIVAKKPMCKLFSGLPGSGKTTELLRLQARLHQKANLFTAHIDTLDFIDPSSTIDVFDVLASALAGAERAVSELEGKDPEKSLEEGYFSRFRNWLSSELGTKNIQLSLPPAGRLVLEMKNRPDLRRQIREITSLEFTRFHRDICDELDRIQVRVQQQGFDGMVLILDSLEKLRGLSTNWHEVLQSAEKVFQANFRFLQLPVHTLYLVPPALLTRIKESRLDFFPMIKVRERNGSLFAPGISIARELIRRRIPDSVMKEILGEQLEERLSRLITSSGGYPRQILETLQEILLCESFPVTESMFRRSLAHFSDPYKNIVYTSAYNWLAEVAVKKSMNLEHDAHIAIADRMLQQHAVQRYQNEQMWYDLHPAVREIPGVMTAIERFEL